MTLVLRKRQDTSNIVVFSRFFLLREITNDVAARGVTFGLYIYIKERWASSPSLRWRRETTNHDVVHEGGYIIIQGLAMGLSDQMSLKIASIRTGQGNILKASLNYDTRSIDAFHQFRRKKFPRGDKFHCLEGVAWHIVVDGAKTSWERERKTSKIRRCIE